MVGKRRKRREKGSDRMRREGSSGGQWLVTPSFPPSFWLQTTIQLSKDTGLGVRILPLSPRHLSVLLKCFPGNPGMKPGLRSTSLDEYSQLEWGKLDQSAGMLSLHGGISAFIYPCHAISRWGWWFSQHHTEEELHHLLYTVPGTGQLVSSPSFLRPSLSRHSLP